MAGRLRNLIARAVGAGFFDPRGWVGSDQDWTSLIIRLRVFERHLEERVAHLDAMRCVLSLSLVDTGASAEDRQKFAVDGVNRYRGALMPWMRQNTRQTVGDATDDLLDWYSTFRPDLLKEALNG